ncbi:MAG: tRNA (cytidine(34)-2'-O)-methyltransferase [Desulfovibrio sp.]|nr:tRNA (cytidine(34)-2'-O)-methyltransferase [Desulfovibrio sp.]
MQIVLFEPEIPPNTGNIARLCAATGTVLHLVEPLGFRLEDRYLKRAGLDYWPNVTMRVWKNWGAFLERDGRTDADRLVMVSSKRRVQSRPFHLFSFTAADLLVFGPETRGLPDNILTYSPYHIRVPMLPGGVRSLNLSTCAGIVLYMALCTLGIPSEWM